MDNTVIPLSRPDITEGDIEAVVEALRSLRLSMGPRQARFEEMVADLTNRRHGIAVSSGTAALHILLHALDVGPGDEVITTPFSFIASANPIMYVGAKPVFVDIDARSLNMDPDKLEAAITPNTKAIIGVETFGNPVHMDRLAQIAQAHEIPLIEDACEAIGGVYNGKPVGSFGRAGVFGFYPNKQITTGEGGIIVTDDDRLADLCRSLRNQGRSVATQVPNENFDSRIGSWLSHERLGFNYRLSEMACALGIAQVDRLPDMLAARRRIVGMYMQRLMGWEDVILPNVEGELDETMSWFVFVLRLSHRFSQEGRDRIIKGLHRHDIGAGNYFPCIHLQPFYAKKFGFKRGDFPIAESVAQRTIALPFFNNMVETQVELVCHTLKVMMDRERLLMQDD